MPKKKLSQENTLLCVVDMQQRLMPHIFNADQVVQGCATLARAAALLEIPILRTEQYPAGLGHTVEALQQALESCPPIEKTTFSCYGSAVFRNTARQVHKNTLLLCGIESHVCILQTALDALVEHVRVMVVADAISSRSEANHQLALDRMRRAGVTIISVEMALMEWLGHSRHPQFKAVQALIK